MTKGNVDDRVPVPDLTKDLTGFIYADKGYISSFDKISPVTQNELIQNSMIYR